MFECQVCFSFMKQRLEKMIDRQKIAVLLCIVDASHQSFLFQLAGL